MTFIAEAIRVEASRGAVTFETTESRRGRLYFVEQAETSIEMWMLNAVIRTPRAGGTPLDENPNFLLDWSTIADYSNVDVSQLVFGFGARYRGSSGVGFSLSYFGADFTDNEPIVEDETGEYSRLTALFSKAF